MPRNGFPADEESTTAGHRAPDRRPVRRGAGPGGTHADGGHAADHAAEERTFHGTRVTGAPSPPPPRPGSGMSAVGIGGPPTPRTQPPPPPPPPSHRQTGPATVAGLDDALGAPAPGQRLADFRVVGELGRGAMGVVVRATDDRLRRPLAVKVMLRPDDQRSVTRFVEEAQITGQLEHPNIVPVHELGTDADGRPWLAMKEVRGQTLRHWIEQRRDDPRPVTADEAGWMIDTVSRVCDAMSFAHHCGVIHRDLKPDNVMLGDFGEVLVMDWGLARASDRPDGAPVPPTDVGSLVRTDRRESGSMLTVDGDICGTPAFMAPEQANGRIRDVGEATDIFAIGAILYSLLTLDAPYRGKTVVEVLAKASRHELVPPRARAPKRRIPRELDAIVRKAMDANPRRRYPTCAALKHDLQAVRNHEPIVALRDGPLRRLVKSARRHPAAALGVTLTTVFVAVIVTVAGLLHAQTQVAEQRAEQARQAERAARLEALAREGRIEELMTALGGTLRSQRDEVVSEFLRRSNEFVAAGGTVEEFIEQLGDERARFIGAFEKMMAAHDRYGDAIPVEAADYFYLGILYQHTGRSGQALDMYNRAIDLDPGLAGVWHNRGNLYDELGDRERALADYTEALRLEPMYHGARLNRGNQLRQLDRIDEALEEYNRLLDEDPHNWKALVNRGICRHKQGRHHEALADLNTALGMHPDVPAALLNRANIKRDIGDRDGAMADYARAVELDETFYEAWFARGAVRQMEGDLTGAIADYERALEVNPELADAWSNRGFARRQLGDRDGALDDFDHAIALDPDNTNALHNRGSTRIETGNLAGALADLNRAIDLEPSKWQLYVNKGMALARLGRRSAAAAAFDEAERQAPGEHHGVIEQYRRRELGE